jgi:predicted anti-sigma-YlaC factor YlaD
VRCERFREAYSAGLDDEPLGVSAAALADHIDACTDCAAWTDAASRVTRLARLDVTPVPDLTDAITAGVVLPARRVLRRRHLLRAALLVTGVVQVGIGIPQLSDQSMGMSMAAHAAHEAAAWNLAIGAAFLAAAVVPRRAAGLIPLLGTFTAVLAVLSIRDLADGAVTAAHLATHLAIFVGLGLLIALERAQRALPPGRSNATDRSHRDERPRLRGVA